MACELSELEEWRACEGGIAANLRNVQRMSFQESP
jgi:hypothetical protein